MLITFDRLTWAGFTFTVAQHKTEWGIALKKILAVGAALALATPLPVLAAGTASWTLWNPSPTTPFTGTFVQNSNTITVTYTGDIGGPPPGLDFNSYIYDVPSSFTNAVVTNTPGSNGTVDLNGGTSTVDTFTFSRPVINPLIDLFSVGQAGVPVQIQFLGNPTFSIGASGAGNWGGGTLTQSGSTVTGVEGNGLLQFQGTFSSISFVAPNFEYYYGATVGGLTTAVPEPETYAMMLFGLGVMGVVARRRRRI